MKAIIAAALITMIPLHAYALSCMRPDMVSSYKDHAEAPESYIVVRGKFRFTPPKPQPIDNTAKPQTVKARFDGVALGKTSFSTSFSRPVTIFLGCAGPWCASAAPDTEVLAFLQKTENGLVLNEGPCPHRVFYEPDKDTVDRLLYCHRRGICD
jgi:hypothetical protein